MLYYKTSKNGKERDIFDGDLLINASVKKYILVMPFTYARLCTSVGGDIIASVTRG